LDQRPDAVTDDHDHVAVFNDVKLIADASVSRNHQRAALARHDWHRRDREVDNAAERVDLALNAAATR